MFTISCHDGKLNVMLLVKKIIEINESAAKEKEKKCEWTSIQVPVLQVTHKKINTILCYNLKMSAK